MLLYELLYKYMYLKDHINAHNNPLRTAWCLKATFVGIMLQCNAVLNGLTIFQNFTTMYLSPLTVQWTFSLQWTLFVQWTRRLTDWPVPTPTDWLGSPLQKTDSAARSNRLTRQPAPKDWLGSPRQQTDSAARSYRRTQQHTTTDWLTRQRPLQQTDWLASNSSNRLTDSPAPPPTDSFPAVDWRAAVESLPAVDWSVGKEKDYITTQFEFTIKLH